MADFEHRVKSFDVADHLDHIASADPPAYLRRSFGAPTLNWRRTRPSALCARWLDAILDDRAHEFFDRERISESRSHYGARGATLEERAWQALICILACEQPRDADGLAALGLLHNRGSGAG